MPSRFDGMSQEMLG